MINPRVHHLLVLLMLLIPYRSFTQSDAEEIRRLVSARFDWLIRHQYDSLHAVLDEQLEYIHSNGWVETRDDVIQNLKTRRLVYKNVTIEQINVRIYGGTAIVTGRGLFSGEMSGNAFSTPLLFTEVYVRKDNRWKLVLRHACRVP